MPRRKPTDPDRSPDLAHNWVERHLERAAQMIYYDAVDLPDWEQKRARLTGPGEYEYLDTDWQPIRLGENWGGEEATVFFRRSLTIPESYEDSDEYDTVLDISLDGGECLLSIDGKPFQGLDCYRSLVPLGDLARAGRTLSLEMEAFIINYPYDARRGEEREIHCFERARLLKKDKILNDFYQDARFALDAYLSWWKDDSNREVEDFLLHHLRNACRIIGPAFENREQARRAAKEAAGYLKREIYESAAYRKSGTVRHCGHSHLDIVYLWPIKETFRKNIRTACNVLSLMREYPDFKFSASQPFLFEKMKESAPAVFEEVKSRVAEGRWEVTGAMYVEPDGNIPGAESLVRQILFGKRFYQKEFGVNTETCWLPDVFGVMYTLPQILKKSGVNYFSSIKLNIWNDTNDFPHNSFRWRGPDGSEVLSHFPPTHFAVDCKPALIRKNWENFKEKNSVRESLFLYGWADGGGGPTREMAEAASRCGSFPGMPKGEVSFVEDYLKTLDSKAAALPVWDDELYLEAHRGTYTSKGELKKYNRQGELLYRDAEILCSIAASLGAPPCQKELNEGWKLLLVNQFHDTLPGTHVPEAVPDIRRDYQECFRIGEHYKVQALEYLSSRTAAPQTEGLRLLVYNTLSWPRSGLVKLSDSKGYQSVYANGRPCPVQPLGEDLWVRTPPVPAMGWTSLELRPEQEDAREKTLEIRDRVLETSFYIIELNADGTLKRIYDKQKDREVLAGAGNCFQVFEDDPGHSFSGWDIASHFEEYQYPVHLESDWELVSNGPLFAVLKAQWRVLNSRIEQEMRLYAHDPRIDFRTTADWQDSRKLLKAAFPLKVRSCRAAYDLPFGSIERPTHRNTSWDEAKFEVCGHKWADLSEGDYGAALLNDCKYGYDIRDNVLRLSLLRAPVRPDARSDLGIHEFSYSLLPHGGNWQQAQVDRRAYEFNIPLLPLESSGGSKNAEMPPEYSFLELSGNAQIVEALKMAEEGEGLILRSFDSHGTHSKNHLKLPFGAVGIQDVNLLEEPAGETVPADGGELLLSFEPYEIKSHKIVFKS